MHDVPSLYVCWYHTGSLTLVSVTRGLNFLQHQSQNSTGKLERRLGPCIVSTPSTLAAVFMQPLFQNSLFQSCQLVKSFCLVGCFFSVRQSLLSMNSQNKDLLTVLNPTSINVSLLQVSLSSYAPNQSAESFATTIFKQNIPNLKQVGLNPRVSFISNQDLENTLLDFLGLDFNLLWSSTIIMINS